jgi:hypothetical protein
VESAEEKIKDIGNPIAMFDHIYEQLPPYLVEQRDRFSRELAETEQEG